MTKAAHVSCWMSTAVAVSDDACDCHATTGDGFVLVIVRDLTIRIPGYVCVQGGGGHLFPSIPADTKAKYAPVHFRLL
eukprot:CAMPEP_0174291206 /NCGR_PEP_ID=MMETSP0809-20121228/31339_1 /TAXON_ID=73025 ORGANISM="Eutreptiella gymnastica-like, Strain CCMP1594" /NCGR_SAMPLE_ID=MMETSP0809 /ASSEMBLY_ACC=CAM_ASM_000658 /LENGTH=77 /DNA_ID=CAMNT_0015390385 /DNA_START=47 /DNA_END=277 /DNA_ORIENTATION=+